VYTRCGEFHKSPSSLYTNNANSCEKFRSKIAAVFFVALFKAWTASCTLAYYRPIEWVSYIYVHLYTEVKLCGQDCLDCQYSIDCFFCLRGACCTSLRLSSCSPSTFFHDSQCSRTRLVDLGYPSSLARRIWLPAAGDAARDRDWMVSAWSSTVDGSLRVRMRARQTTHRRGRQRSLMAVWIVRTKQRRQVTRWAHGKVCIVATADRHTTHYTWHTLLQRLQYLSL